MNYIDKIKSLVNKAYLNLLELVFPRFCLGCKKEGRYICDNCLIFISESSLVCPICQKSSYFGKVHKSCFKSSGLNGLINFWDYDGIIKNIIYSVKYKKHFHVLEEVMENIISLIKRDTLRFSFFVDFLLSKEMKISFVPLHEKKERDRGFNQSEKIANHFAKMADKDSFKLLKRDRETKSQTGLDKKERFLNVSDAFSLNINKEELPKKILLIDDVWTSGATMKECSKILKKNGVKEVWGLTIAKT